MPNLYMRRTAKSRPVAVMRQQHFAGEEARNLHRPALDQLGARFVNTGLQDALPEVRAEQMCCIEIGTADWFASVEGQQEVTQLCTSRFRRSESVDSQERLCHEYPMATESLRSFSSSSNEGSDGR